MSTKNPRVVVYLTIDQNKKLEEIASFTGMSKSGAIKQAVAQYLLSFGLLQEKADIKKIIAEAVKLNEQLEQEEKEREEINKLYEQCEDI